jgi:hypothetical protein
VQQADPRLPAKARGYAVIKSVSKKQRARRVRAR